MAERSHCIYIVKGGSALQNDKDMTIIFDEFLRSYDDIKFYCALVNLFFQTIVLIQRTIGYINGWVGLSKMILLFIIIA